MSGLSKIAGLPQMKLGWIVVSGPGGAARGRHWRSWSGSPTRTSRWARRCSARRALCCKRASWCRCRSANDCATHLSLAREALAGSPANILAVEGGWYVTVQAPRVRSEEEWCLELLACEDVLVQPGFFYDFESEAYLVVSLLTAPEIFREGMARLRRQLDGA